MVPIVYTLLTIFLPVVCCLSSSQVHTEGPVSGSVGIIEVRSTVRPSGSYIVFRWEHCSMCDGYDARLHLEDNAGEREIPYQLKSLVNSLGVTNLAPGTAFRLAVKTLSLNAPDSVVSGRISSSAAPYPVKNLIARALTSSSIEIEWYSSYADGFLVRALLPDGTEGTKEETISEFSNHTAKKIEGLIPDTTYEVRVSAYFSRQNELSKSAVSSARVRTLPVKLPALDLSWELGAKLKLFWNNPESPRPVKHRLNCTQGWRTIYEAELSGQTDFVALPRITRSELILCELNTWFSTDVRLAVTTKLSIPKEQEKTTSFTEELFCRGSNHTEQNSDAAEREKTLSSSSSNSGVPGHSPSSTAPYPAKNHTVHYAANVTLQNTGRLLVQFSKNPPNELQFNEVSVYADVCHPILLPIKSSGARYGAMLYGAIRCR